jgi:hypothetical protein
MEKYNELFFHVKGMFPKASKIEINVTVGEEEITKFSQEVINTIENDSLFVINEHNINLKTGDSRFKSVQTPYGKINLIKSNG